MAQSVPCPRCWAHISLCFVYPDVAVGAPFAGQGGSGRVFIYNGHSEGLQTPASQVLDSPFPGRASFGFSVRGATDIDANGYPGMEITAVQRH